jgi:hypothetical protein
MLPQLRQLPLPLPSSNPNLTLLVKVLLNNLLLL